MSQLEKALHAAIEGKELSWERLKPLLKNYGATIISPPGGGSHFKIIFPNLAPLFVPVHKGRIKKIYAKQIADALKKITLGE